mmetsp:Transcript_23155/g.52342  ORF Transcript_23155/g.52342 Transcript_23155/m.52342 type:complete len:179 (+) Transcript_23155:425-961(+)
MKEGQHLASGTTTPDCVESAVSETSALEDPSDRTTVLLKGLPTRHTVLTMAELLNQWGFENRFDYIYIPLDIKSRSENPNGPKQCYGFGFINFTDPVAASHLVTHFKMYAEEKMSICWARVQGVEGNVVEYWQRAAERGVKGSVEDMCRPWTFEGNDGTPVPVPHHMHYLTEAARGDA